MNRILDSDNQPSDSQLVVDSNTLVSNAQKRFLDAIKHGYQYDSALNPAQDYLSTVVNSKTSFVMMFIDLVGSTRMSMTMPIDRLAIVMSAFSFELSSLIHSHGGFVLKYIGDGLIGFFPSNFNKLLACDKAVHCANSALTVLEKGLNPVFKQNDYPELSVKIGLDEGETVVVRYGKSLPIDILGYSISIAAKITAITKPNQISIGENVYRILHPQIRKEFMELGFPEGSWKYTDKETGMLYKVYTTQFSRIE